MDSSSLVPIWRFIWVLLLQVLVFNGIELFGAAQPMILVLFLFSYPTDSNYSLSIFLSFLLGLVVDSFTDTLALNALGMTVAAYFRPHFLRLAYGISAEYHNDSKLYGSLGQHSYFLFLLLSLHHLIFFTAETFDLSRAFVILKQLAVHLPLSFLVGWLLIQLFSLQKR
jgi:hypothetical protein